MTNGKPARVVQGCSGRGTVIVYDRCHPLGLEVRLTPGDPSHGGRRGFASSGGGPFNSIKKRRFDFPALSPGAYTLRATLGDREPLELALEVEADEVVEVSVRVTHHPALRLRREEIIARLATTDPGWDYERHECDVDEVFARQARTGPTATYLMSKEPGVRTALRQAGRPNRRGKLGPVAVWKNHHYFKQYTLPVEAIIQREHERLRTHVPLYTGMAFDFLLLHYFCRELVAQGVGDQALAEVRWFRHPLSRSPYERNTRYADVRDLLAKLTMTGQRINDNDTKYSWQLQSCNAHLFGNALVSSEESTVDFYWDGMIVNAQNIETIMGEVLDEAGMLPASCGTCAAARRSALERMLAALDRVRPAECPKGVLFQLLVPHAIVNQVAYITRTVKQEMRNNGEPDTDHPDCLRTLVGMQTATATSLSSYEDLQVRLYLPLVLQPGSGIVIHQYCNAPDRDIEELQREVSAAVAQLLEASAEDREQYVEVLAD